MTPTEAPFLKPGYPGDAVLIQRFTRREEIGDVRIMQYGTPAHDKFRIACFLPGESVFLPGDTPKVEPERDCWRNTEAAARRVFGIYVRTATHAGWMPCPEK